jgi:hypothetical protein
MVELVLFLCPCPWMRVPFPFLNERLHCCKSYTYAHCIFNYLACACVRFHAVYVRVLYFIIVV